MQITGTDGSNDEGRSGVDAETEHTARLLKRDLPLVQQGGNASGADGVAANHTHKNSGSRAAGQTENQAAKRAQRAV